MNYSDRYAIKPNQNKPNHIHRIYMYKKDLALNDLQKVDMPWNQTKPNQIIDIQCICIKRIWH